MPFNIRIDGEGLEERAKKAAFIFVRQLREEGCLIHVATFETVSPVEGEATIVEDIGE